MIINVGKNDIKMVVNVIYPGLGIYDRNKHHLKSDTKTYCVVF